MKIQTWRKVLAMLAISAGISGAQAMADDIGWYGGLNLGQSRANIDDERIAGDLLAAGFTQSVIVDDDHDLGLKVFAGYQLNRYLAVEGGYFNLGEFGFAATTQPMGTLRGEVKIQGVNLDLVGVLPLTQKWSVFGRAGVNYAASKTTFAGTGAVQVDDPDRSERAAHHKLGLGLQYDFTPQLGIRAELERYRIDDTVENKGDIDLASLGLVYRFKADAPVRVEQLVAPEPASDVVLPPAVAAAPLLPLPAPLPTPRRVTLSADSYFDFDRALLKPAGQKALDQLVAELQRTSFAVITVVGHTDHLGSSEHNLALSLRRAEAVKHYLVESGGIQARQIAASGAGSLNPVTVPGECERQFTAVRSPRLFACLQPDRRVEVEVSATP